MAEIGGAYWAALTAGTDTGGGVLSLANPDGRDLLVTRLVLHLTTAATAACTLDAGIAAAATTSADDLIDGLDANAAAGVFDNIDDQGTNGQSCQNWDSDEFLTVSTATGASAGLVGYAYIEYIPVQT